MAFTFPLLAQDTTSTGTMSAPAVPSDNDAAAHTGYPPERYQELWTKSAFAVETPDEAVTDSADYLLVGVAQIGDVTYASLIQKQNQNHLLVSSDKPLGGLTLNSLSNKSDGIYVSFSRDGQPLTLKLEAAPAGGGAAPTGNANPGAPPVYSGAQGTVQAAPMPGSFNPATARPLIHIRRPLIHVPPRLSGQPDPPPGAGPGQQP